MLRGLSGHGVTGFNARTSIGITNTRPWLLAQTYVGTGYIGAYYPDNTYTNNATLHPEYFNGSIADVAYFNRALHLTGVSTIYGAGRPQASLLSRDHPAA